MLPRLGAATPNNFSQVRRSMFSSCARITLSQASAIKNSCLAMFGFVSAAAARRHSAASRFASEISLIARAAKTQTDDAA